MFHDNKPARVAGPFGYTLRDLAARSPEERDEMRRELDALDNKLQWGFEPGRWAKGAAWHDDDWRPSRTCWARASWPAASTAATT